MDARFANDMTLGLTLYMLAMVLGAWSAARLWRAFPRLITRRTLVAALAVLVATALFLAGAHLRGGVTPPGAPPVEFVAFAIGVLCMLLGLGAVLAAFARPLTRRRFLIFAILGILLLGAAHTVNVLPRVQTRGLRAGIPTSVLILTWPWLPEGAVAELDAGPTSRQLAAWHRSLLRWRCAGIICGSTDRELLRRAARLYPDSTSYPSASPRLLRELFADYCSEDALASDRAAEFLFVTLTDRFIPARFDDATATELVPFVQAGLQGHRASTIQRSAWTIERMGGHARDLVWDLERIIRASPDAGDLTTASRAALSGLAATARESSAAWLVLSSLLRDPDERLQVAALQEFMRAEFKGRVVEVTPALVGLIESASDRVAAGAVTTLLYLAPDPCAHAGAIAARAARTDEVAIRAVPVLAERCPDAPIDPIIARLLASSDYRARRFAIDACAAMGPRAASHRDALLQLARPDAPDRDLAEAAAAALKKVDGAAPR